MNFKIRFPEIGGQKIAAGLFAFMFLGVFASVLAVDDIDLGYDPAVGRPYSNDQINILRLSDGKFMVFGYEAFSNFDGASKSKIARLNSDGTVDDSFRCECDTFTYINGVAEQPDGKLIIGGAYSSGSSARLARINPDGSRDFSLYHRIRKQVEVFHTRWMFGVSLLTARYTRRSVAAASGLLLPICAG